MASSGKLLNGDEDDGTEKLYDDSTLGPHPSVVLKDIVSTYYKSYPQKQKIQKPKKSQTKSRQGTTSLISTLTSHNVCMKNPSDLECIQAFR